MVSRMANSATGSLFLLSTVAVIISVSLLPTSDALIPFPRNPIWDLMLPADDPFKTLEQTPLSIPRSSADPAAELALARADWKETPTAHHIALDVPGIPREAIKIEIEDPRVLRISGERKAEGGAEAGDGEKWHRAERVEGKFWRQFRLPGNADMEGIRARLENGVLEITVPKLAEEKRLHAKVVDIAATDQVAAASSSLGGGGGGEEIKASKVEL